MLPKSFLTLIKELSRLPGIGPRGAERIAMHLFTRKNGALHSLSDAILHLRDSLQFCRECYYLSDAEECEICTDSSRQKTLMCVVETVMDVAALEKTGQFRGVYHVLHGRLSPLKNIEAKDIKLQELIRRIAVAAPHEIIIATNPDAEGEMTALYIQKMLTDGARRGSGAGIKLTRIARGIPVGGDLQYADDITLRRALEGRTLL